MSLNSILISFLCVSMSLTTANVPQNANSYLSPAPSATMGQTSPGNVKFIDYEYAGYNYQAYDIGNHFNEFAGLNEVDYSHYPGQAFQLQWLRSYLEAYKEHKGQCSDVTDREVEILFVQVNRFALASHFFWGLWALIQAKFSTIDFDFLGYAVLRFNQYFKMKPEAAALNFPE